MVLGMAYIEIPHKDRELMQGIIDLHVHAAPDLYERPFDEIELAKQFREVGYRAVLFKSHFTINADRAFLVRKITGFEVYGGIVLNRAVGGLNPKAVEAAIGFGAKEVWMPNIDAANHIRVIGVSSYPSLKYLGKGKKEVERYEGIAIFTSEGEIIPEVYEILDLIADADIILGTGHLSLKEIFALIDAAKRAGVRKILVTHPEWEATYWSIEDQIKMAEMGAILEHCITPCMPFETRRDPKIIADAIKKVGADRCVMATDLGQVFNPHPIEGMRQYIQMMIKHGIEKREIERMTKDNPAKLLE
jgi:hypothetical protein